MTTPLPTKPPEDDYPYDPDPASRPYGPDLEPGDYVFVEDADGVVHVLHESPFGHQPPKILGGNRPAAAAGGLRVGPGGVIMEIDNYSGTFRFGAEIFPQVRDALTRQGGQVAAGAERYFPH